MKTVRLVILILTLPLYLYAQLDDFMFRGYVKYLPSWVKYPETSFVIPGYPDLGGETLADQLIHFRLNSKWYASDNITAALEFRSQIIHGESVEKIPNFKDLYFSSSYENANLEWTMWETDNSIGYTQIDRLYLDYFNDNLQITFGRQRVAWGTSWVWNITDLFNPMDILDFDYEERPGMDGIRGQYYTGAVSKFEVVYKPGSSSRLTTLAGAWAYNLNDFDTFVLIGKKNGLWTFGGNWAGDIKGAGFRGEILYTEALSGIGAPESDSPDFDPSILLDPDFPSELFIDLLFGSFYNDTDPNISFVLSADYTFPSSFYIHTEMMHNSNGKTENAGFYTQQALDVGMRSPARWSVFQEFSYDVSALVRASLYGIYNPDDRSYIIVPSFTWSIITNLDFMLIAFVSSGYELTEFGYYGEAVYLRLKYSF